MGSEWIIWMLVLGAHYETAYASEYRVVTWKWDFLYALSFMHYKPFARTMTVVNNNRKRTLLDPCPMNNTVHVRYQDVSIYLWRQFRSVYQFVALRITEALGASIQSVHANLPVTDHDTLNRLHIAVLSNDPTNKAQRKILICYHCTVYHSNEIKTQWHHIQHSIREHLSFLQLSILVSYLYCSDKNKLFMIYCSITLAWNLEGNGTQSNVPTFRSPTTTNDNHDYHHRLDRFV